LIKIYKNVQYMRPWNGRYCLLDFCSYTRNS